MVGPISDAERRSGYRLLAIGFVGLVGLSSALTALYGGATITAVGAIGLGGTVVGVSLLLALGVGR